MAEAVNLPGVEVAEFGLQRGEARALLVLLAVIAARLLLGQHLQRAAVHLAQNAPAQQAAAGAEEIQPPVRRVVRDVKVALQRAQRAVFQAHHQAGSVFHPVGEGLGVLHGGHLADGAAGDVGDEIDHMHAHVHQRAAAGGLGRLPPGAGDVRIPAGEAGIQGHQGPDVTRLTALLHLPDVAAKAHHQPRRQRQLFGREGIDDDLPVSAAERQRLFNQQGLSRLAYQKRLAQMLRHRGGDVHRIHLRIPRQLGGVGIQGFDAVFFPEAA